MKIGIVIFMILPTLFCDRIMLLNLTPDVARGYISKHPLDLRYAKLVGENTIPSNRRYFRGRLIDDPENFIEQTYEANQFHGQDGLGRAMFGYADWNQGRLEARNINGDVRGSYQYVDPFGEDVQVNYWSDSLGFHQSDNRPKFINEPVTETQEVREAREQFERAWKQAALAANENPDPMSDIYNRNANRLDEERAKREQAMEILASVANRNQNVININDNMEDGHQSEASGDSIVIQAKGSIVDESESNSEPRGFFYDFDYPVHVIRQKDEYLRTAPRGGKSYTASGETGKEIGEKVVENRSTDVVGETKKIIKITTSTNKEKVYDVEQLEKSSLAVAEDTLENTNVIESKLETQSKPAEIQTKVVPKTKVNNLIEQIIPVAIKYDDTEIQTKTIEFSRNVDGIHDAQVHPKSILKS